jgi:hypothetical protein
MPKVVSLPMISRVQIASPCPVRWSDMNAVGDGARVRHCDQCDLNVYNLSEMTADEAEALLVANEGRRLCGAFYRREDGTVLTRDCPVGLALVRAKLAKVVARLSAAAGLLMTSVVMLGDRVRSEPVRLRQIDPFAKIVAWLNPVTPAALPAPGQISMTMGSLACAPPPPPAPLSGTPSAPQLFAPAALDLNGGDR